MFKIEWVNHASYIFDDGEIRLITDPWLEGSVFNESWNLISKTVFTYEDFKSIDYIWFSHEHPDHFFPPNLKKIPEEIRQNITILFQKTDDKKVLEFCKNIGFKDVIEVFNSEFKLSSKTKIYISPFSKFDTDSWMLLNCNGVKLLNVNDCILNNTKTIKKLKTITGEVDYLFTQFSYANWVGNPNDEQGRKEQALEKLKRISNQIDIFKPRFVVPFASFVYFAKKENYFMNSTVNTVEDIMNFLSEKKVKTLLMYPGDIYSEGEWNNNEQNIAKYGVDFQNIKNIQAYNIEKQSNFASVEESFKKGPFYLFNMGSIPSRILTSVIGTRIVKIKLSDLEFIVEVDLLTKEILKLNTDKFDLCLTSQNLEYILKFSWGPGTILIAGTFYTQNANGLKFMHYMSEISHCISQGKIFSYYYALNRIWGLITNKIFRIFDKFNIA